MPEKIRIGLIGAGNIAQNAHIPAYLKQEDVELVAVCDINEARAIEVAAKYNMKFWTTDLNELAALPYVDAISVCTWNNAHAAAVIAAAKNGKHILCEKPMCMNATEAEAMRAAVKEAGVVFMMGFVNRFRPESTVLKALEQEGRFGNIYHADATLLRRRGTPLGWFTNTQKSGGGPVIDIGVHLIDLTWYLMGKPKPVALSATTYAPLGDYQIKGVGRWEAFDTDDKTFDTEDSANGMIRFDNGATMNFHVSWAINGPSTELLADIYGDKAGAKISPLAVYGVDGGYLSDSVPTFKEYNIFEAEIRHFVDCVQGKATPISPIEDGIIVQSMLNGIYESAKQGKEIKL